MIDSVRKYLRKVLNNLIWRYLTDQDESIPDWVKNSKPKRDSAEFIAKHGSKTVDELQNNKLEWNPEDGWFK